MTEAVTAREHLESIAEEALEIYDRGDKTDALACCISRLKQHEDTKKFVPSVMLIVAPSLNRGREAFRDAILGFAT